MMFRRTGQQDDSDLLEARRRLQASMFGDNVNGAGGAADSQQQLQFYREQQMLLDARAAALGSSGQSNAQQNMNPQHFNNSFSSSSSSFAQQQQQQSSQSNNIGGQMGGQSSMNQQQMLEQLQQQQLQQQGGPGGGQFGGASSSAQGAPSTSLVGDEAGFSRLGSNMLSEQRLAIQRAQLEVQRHAQAQAQAEARVKALLGQEAQVQDQMRLLRQRQLQSPSSQTTLSQSAYDMLASPAGGAGRTNFGNSANGEWGAAGTGVGVGVGNQLDNARLGNTNVANRAAFMGLQSGGTAPRQQQQQTNCGLPTSLGGDETAIFGKISRQTSEQLISDVALQQSRRGAADDHKNKQDHGDDNGKEGPDAESSDDDEEEHLDDDEYFKAQAGEPGADGGYPVAREAFPIKLYRILYEAEKNKQDDIISFFPHGRAFAVHKSKEFTRDIMPKYFPAGRMNTFLKQLNLYGFRRITEGRDKGGYFHKDFLKGKRHLCKKIKRKKVHVTKAPPSAPAVHQHFQLQQNMQSQLSFLSDPLGGALGNHPGLNSGHHQLLQQQQMADRKSVV